MIAVFFSAVAMILAALLNPVNHYLSALVLILSAAVIYFTSVIICFDRNWLDIRAAFPLFWMGTIGFAALRLTDYQKAWELKTWLLLTLTQFFFLIGCEFALWLGEKILGLIQKSKRKPFLGFSLILRENRLFWCAFAVTLMGFFSFIANIFIRGYLPFFSSSQTAYLDFYTKFYVFSAAGAIVSGLSYYVLITQKNSLWRKAFLIFSIVYSTFVFPIMVVSRGIFMMSALSLVTVMFYLHRKKLVILFLSFVVMAGCYALMSSARGYSEEQLESFFEPSEIQTDFIVNEDVETKEEQPNEEKPIFQLSGSDSFVYCYLTVSHDNFNEAVANNETYTFGARQLSPFNVLLKLDVIENALESSPIYLVRSHLNTVNLVGDAYYDFGSLGCVILPFIWGLCFQLFQFFHERKKGLFSLLLLGTAMTPVILSFFSGWMSNFTLWMYFALNIIMFFASHITRKNKQ